MFNKKQEVHHRNGKTQHLEEDVGNGILYRGSIK